MNLSYDDGRKGPEDSVSKISQVNQSFDDGRLGSKDSCLPVTVCPNLGMRMTSVPWLVGSGYPTSGPESEHGPGPGIGPPTGPGLGAGTDGVVVCLRQPSKESSHHSNGNSSTATPATPEAGGSAWTHPAVQAAR